MDTAVGFNCLNAPQPEKKLTKNQKKKLRKKQKAREANVECSDTPVEKDIERNNQERDKKEHESDSEAIAVSGVSQLSISTTASLEDVAAVIQAKEEDIGQDRQNNHCTPQTDESQVDLENPPSVSVKETCSQQEESVGAEGENANGAENPPGHSDEMPRHLAAPCETTGPDCPPSRREERCASTSSDGRSPTRDDRNTTYQGRGDRPSGESGGQRSKHQQEEQPNPESGTKRKGKAKRKDKKRKREERQDWWNDGESREGKAGRQEESHGASGGPQYQQHGRQDSHPGNGGSHYQDHGQQESHPGSSGSSYQQGGHQNSYGSMRNSDRDNHAPDSDDSYRKMADAMKYHIRNPRYANLDEYQGYVYAYALAVVLGIPEQMLIQLAKKYDAEFEVYVDNQSNTNIRLKRSERREDDPDTKLSKKLSSLLRHRAEDKGFRLLDGGFLFVEDILKRGEFRSFNEKDVARIVRNNDKQRFTLDRDEKSGKLKIRANQGHSMKVENLELKSLTAKDVPCCVHGTSFKAWEMIKTSGLKTMGRNHIHFAPGEPGESGVISGMRSSCQVLVFVDMDKAIADGIKFYLSSNNVILTEGGRYNTLSPYYFQRVIDRNSRKELPFSKPQPRDDHDQSSQQPDKKNQQAVTPNPEPKTQKEKTSRRAENKGKNDAKM